MAKLTVTTKFTKAVCECDSYKYTKGSSFGTLVTYDKDGSQLEVITFGNGIGGDNPSFKFEE